MNALLISTQELWMPISDVTHAQCVLAKKDNGVLNIEMFCGEGTGSGQARFGILAVLTVEEATWFMTALFAHKDIKEPLVYDYIHRKVYYVKTASIPVAQVIQQEETEQSKTHSLIQHLEIKSEEE